MCKPDYFWAKLLVTSNLFRRSQVLSTCLPSAGCRFANTSKGKYYGKITPTGQTSGSILQEEEAGEGGRGGCARTMFGNRVGICDVFARRLRGKPPVARGGNDRRDAARFVQHRSPTPAHPLVGLARCKQRHRNMHKLRRNKNVKTSNNGSKTYTGERHRKYARVHNQQALQIAGQLYRPTIHTTQRNSMQPAQHFRAYSCRSWLRQQSLKHKNCENHQSTVAVIYLPACHG